MALEVPKVWCNNNFLSLALNKLSLLAVNKIIKHNWITVLIMVVVESQQPAFSIISQAIILHTGLVQTNNNTKCLIIINQSLIITHQLHPLNSQLDKPGLQIIRRMLSSINLNQFCQTQISIKILAFRQHIIKLLCNKPHGQVQVCQMHSKTLIKILVLMEMLQSKGSKSVNQLIWCNKNLIKLNSNSRCSNTNNNSSISSKLSMICLPCHGLLKIMSKTNNSNNSKIHIKTKG